jgi:hypothetical protein
MFDKKYYLELYGEPDRISGRNGKFVSVGLGEDYFLLEERDYTERWEWSNGWNHSRSIVVYFIGGKMVKSFNC